MFKMFSDSQEKIYEDGREFIYRQLNTILSRSEHAASSLIAFRFVLTVAVEYDESSAQTVVGSFYSETPKVMRFFLKLNDFLCANDSQHRFITAVCDSRLMSANQTKKQLQKAYSIYLKRDIAQWINDNFEGPSRPKEGELDELFAEYQPYLTKNEVLIEGCSP